MSEALGMHPFWESRRFTGILHDSEYVVLRRCDVEALIEEHALDEDPFWRPLPLEVKVPRCVCGSRSLYAEEPPRLGPHHQAACSRWLPPNWLPTTSQRLVPLENTE